MSDESARSFPPPLRVQLVSAAAAAGEALRGLLAEREGIEVAGPVASAAASALAAEFHPQIVLLDFHGLPISIGHTVAELKRLAPPPLVWVLTHDASPAMRRRCRETRVDAIFDKTTELELLTRQLEQSRAQAA